MNYDPKPDPIFKATTPVPSEDISGSKGNMAQSAMPSSPLFWGRNYVPPTPAQTAAACGPQPYPRMMYHPDGRMQVAESEADHLLALEHDWQETPDLAHREMLQFGDQGKSGKRIATAGSPESGGLVQGKEQPKWGMVALATTTKITSRHVKFLKSRGYPVGSVNEVEGFVEKMSTDEAAQFFGDASEWKEEEAAK